MRWSLPLVALTIAFRLLAPLATSPAGVVITDTTLGLDPDRGGPSTTFTATLTYTPRENICPPSATAVSFTWDGKDLGSSVMKGNVSPCRASFATKPLAHYTSTGAHKICGSFESNGPHKGCASFEVTSSSSSPAPQHAATAAANPAGTKTPRASSHTAPSSTTRTTTARAATSTAKSTPRGPDVRAEADTETGSGLTVVKVIGGVALIGVLFWLPSAIRRRRPPHRHV
jgi:hypothetical protein